jgi:hypothetical protein
MKLIKAPVIYPSDPLLETFEQYFFCEGFPTITEADDDEFIENFLDIFKEDTGIEVDRSMVAALPDWDRFNNPMNKKKIMRVKDVEKILIDEPDEVNEEEADDQDDVVESEKEMDVGAEKERRSKKRNERPSSDDEDNATLASRLMMKKQKTIAHRPTKRASKASKGMTSEPNMSSEKLAHRYTMLYTMLQHYTRLNRQSTKQ